MDACMPLPEAKIELLIRKSEAGDGGFSIMEVPSGQVYAGYRPKRVDGSGYELAREVSPVDGRTYYVLKAAGSTKYMYLNEREQFLWDMMDGTRSIKDIATAYYYTFGSLDFSSIKGLLARLREVGLVEFVPASSIRVALDRSNWGWAGRLKGLLSKVDYRIDDADGWVTRVYQGGGYLLVNKYAMGLYFLLSVMGVATFGRFESIGRFPYALMVDHPFLVISVLIASFYPIMAVHEIAHALACKRFGRTVHGFGFTLWDGFYPSFYTDVSDIYMAPRRHRMYVSLAGPVSSTALAALFFVPALISPSSHYAEDFYQVGRLHLLVAFVSLFPFQFLKMDGYYLLVDMLGFPGLRERSSAFMRGLPAFIRSGKPFTRTELIMVSYFALSACSTLGFMAYFFSAV